MEQVHIDSKFADNQGEIMVVELGGHIDQSNSHQLQKMFDNIINSGCFKVIVDFNKLFYMSSAGWGVFIGEIKRFRENGGDIKLANMNSDIYDVYQMLEFYHILEDYTSVEEAAIAFKSLSEGLDFFENPDYQDDHQKKVIELKEQMNTGQVDKYTNNSNIENIKSTEKENSVIEFIPSKSIQDNSHSKNKNENALKAFQQEVKLTELPLGEKIKRIIAESPLIGVFGIRKVLRHEHFGHTKIGILKLWRILKALNLDSKAKRFRYYRSS